ncbi:unnamed protein product [Kuraishia capsulata CBS 1993]|uniref:Coatomer subunit beta' n=1 Tax=Kuraishia capsulata CBS 1993 TaxID=1382522 RepID=W6MFW9_9ASCO|nr:uncharacterized protein KUCA_T00000507001 [Kuraishia capsulata CBS 1993]CDK24541.1 unnamed protein product [Kuraishia capsulata CBS 1993]
MRLDIKKQFSTRSDRVKGIDFHPTEPWVLTTLYSGKVEIWSYETSTKVKTIDVTNVPVRAGKFIARKNWIIVGSDDFQVRVYNYNTGEKVGQFEAHPDYIRSIAVHPTRPYVLTSSDDMTIKLWNWENNWKMEQIFEGHQHYIMSLAFNPKDLNTFASACLDRTVKIWSLGSPVPNFTLMAHESKGVNYVEYYPQSDKPYLITASDDRTIKIWDYQTKACVATLEGHLSNVSFAIFHPELPLIISGSEDASINIWNANTYKLEKTLHYSMERAWCVAAKKGTNLIAVGFDSGHVVLKLGDDKPALSMDPLGKIIWAKQSDVYTSVIKLSDAVTDDGEVLPLSQKELGSVEIFPSTLSHSPNGRFVTVTGDGEYIIYTALAWRNKSYGSALDFVWAQDSNLFAVRESTTAVKIFKNFKEKTSGTVDLLYSADKIFGGSLLAVKSEGFVSFYDWESGALVQRVDVEAQDVVWSDSGELVLIISSETAYALRFNKDVFASSLENGTVDDEDGCEGAFDVLYDVSETITSGKWVGDVFIYTSTTNRLNYLVGGSINNIAHFDKPMYLLGYLSRDNKVYVTDKDLNVISYHISQNVLEYQTVVLRGDMEQAAELLDSIEESERTKVARFLEKQGYKDLALEITNDNEQKFELAIETLDLQKAYEIATVSETEHKWKQLGDTSLANWNLKLAIESFEKAKDLESLLLLYTSLNQAEELQKLGNVAKSQGKYNVAFSALWAAKDIAGCIELLQLSKRFPESAIFALTYNGEQSVVDKAVSLWKESLAADGNKSLSDRICSPSEDSALFPQLGDLIDIGENGKEAAAIETAPEVEAEPEAEPEEEKEDGEQEEEEDEEEEEEG